MMGTEAFKNEIKGKACGLQIFNTSTLCVETWNGTKWIEACMSCEDITFPTVGKTYNFCSSSTATIDTLSAKIGGADFYDAVSGGNKYLNTELLTNGTTYYAVPKVANCVASARTAVTVNLVNCSTAPESARLVTFVNVMYDFQHQTIEAYNTGSGIGTKYEWSVSTSGSANSFTPVPDAPNSPFFTVPANFSDRYNSGDYLCDTLWFQCKITNPKGYKITADNALDIIFIKTTSAGYGIDENTGVRYLKLNRGYNGQTVKNGSTATMKVALLSLGQSADWTLDGDYVPNNDAGDLGDFYQWGRVADGHQNVVWSKNASHKNQILPYGETPACTSDTISYSTINVYDENKQILDTDPSYGKFITKYDNWCYPADEYLWGGPDSDRTTTFPWTYPANNPCPLGWRIPTLMNWWDILNGDGSNDPTVYVIFGSADTNNNWQKRPASSFTPTSTTCGGIIVTNSANENIFLPMMGWRSQNVSTAGNLVNVNSDGYYSSASTSGNHAYILCLQGGSAIITPLSYASRAYGSCARCVAEF
jgi:hypothetical protein